MKTKPPKDTRPFFRRFRRSISLSLSFSRTRVSRWWSVLGAREEAVRSSRLACEMKWIKISKSRNLAAMFTLSLFLRVPPFLSTLVNSNTRKVPRSFSCFFFCFFFFFFFFGQSRYERSRTSSTLLSAFFPPPSEWPSPVCPPLHDATLLQLVRIRSSLRRNFSVSFLAGEWTENLWESRRSTTIAAVILWLMYITRTSHRAEMTSAALHPPTTSSPTRPSRVSFRAADTRRNDASKHVNVSINPRISTKNSSGF